MSDPIKRSLKEELEYYNNLLSKYENGKRRKIDLQKQTWKAPRNVHLNSKNMYVNIKNQIQSLPCLENISSNKLPKFLHNQSTVKQNRRTVLPNSNHKFVSNQLSRNSKSLGNVCNRTVLNRNDIYSSLKPHKNSHVKSPVISSDSLKEKLIKEITAVTQQLKETSEAKSKLFISKKKDETVKHINPCFKKPALHCKKGSASALNKWNSKSTNLVLKSKEENCNMPLKCISVTPTFPSIDNAKKKDIVRVPFKCSNKEILHKSRFQFQKPLTTVGSCREDSIKDILNCDKTLSNLKVCKSQTVLFCNASLQKGAPKTPISQSLNNTSVSLTNCISSNKKKQHASINLGKTKKVCTPRLSAAKSFGVCKDFKPRHAKVNTKYSLISNKNKKLNNCVLNKTISKVSSNKKVSKANSKYKIINKASTPCSIKRKRKFQINNIDPVLKEKSLLLDKSDPLFKVLQDSVVTDKLEQELIAKSTLALASEHQLANNELCSGKKVFSSQYKFKRMPVKKSQVLSKYKVVNRSCSFSKSFVIPNKKISPGLKNTAKKNGMLPKFSFVNKQLQYSTPLMNKRSVLLKRVYKSKSTIINKNVSPTNYSAKMIKSKYLALNKRRPLGWQSYNNSKEYFKGHYVHRNFHLKQKMSHKCRTFAPYYEKTNRFSNYKRTTFSAKNVKSRFFRKKLNHGYIKSPILVIQGVRYSLNSSGKTLTKLSSKDRVQSNKTPKRVVIGGKSFIRMSESVMKAATPVTTNLASRVLHRSISTVLTASTKKKLTKVNNYCMFYNRFGRCNRGVKCTYIHDPSKIAVCTRFLRGTCKIKGCPFSHEVAPGKMAICSFFLVGACTKDGCPYRHEKLSPDAILCKAFVQGYCPNGKECKKAHILICPKFIQGTCEKGDSCAFPHPPQKAKKNVQKDAVDDDMDEKKTGDALLEKVARYFQPLNEESAAQYQNMDESGAINVFIPKQKRLEEQPSFIPLHSTPVSGRFKKLQPCLLKSLQDDV